MCEWVGMSTQEFDLSEVQIGYHELETLLRSSHLQAWEWNLMKNTEDILAVVAKQHDGSAKRWPHWGGLGVPPPEKFC